jgi:transposase
MAKHRTHSIEFKRQVAQEFLAGETLHGLAKRHDISRNLIRVWVQKYEVGDLNEDAQAADLQYEARIGALERLVGRQALRKREHLTPSEIEALIEAAKSFDCVLRSIRPAAASNRDRRLPRLTSVSPVIRMPASSRGTG